MAAAEVVPDEMERLEPLLPPVELVAVEGGALAVSWIGSPAGIG